MHRRTAESLSHDPIHGYIPFISRENLPPGEVSEREIIDHPWVQRLRQIHQLQTAHWVYPAAEHTRFQHVLGAMHLASRAIDATYDSLADVADDVPSRGYVESLLRMAALLHDVGHGPFGHFFDEHFLSQYGLTHETLGQKIILEELGEMLAKVRRNPNSALAENEQLDPAQVAYLIARPREDEATDAPRWLELVRSLLCGTYTVDNMDFVLRDAYMSGYSSQAFDLDRLLRYSFFTQHGLTIDARALDALVRFIGVRGELFRAIYFHRTVRAIDLTLEELFADCRADLFDGNPAENLAAYQGLTEWSLLVDVARWVHSDDERKQQLGQRWQRLLGRQIEWRMLCQRHLVFAAEDSERSSIFAKRELVEHQLMALLPEQLQQLSLRVDIGRYIHRPGTRGPAVGQNFLYDAASDTIRPLTDSQLYRQLPVAHRVCRVYAWVGDDQPPPDDDQIAQVAAALDELIGPGGSDDLTNM
ncbi:MAG: HD domain-containing protein [Pirellulales bacterium]|nr:HD domain-containing protein [Pirellulales bacterium]